MNSKKKLPWTEVWESWEKSCKWHFCALTWKEKQDLKESKLILNESKLFPCSSRISLVLFRTFRGPLFPKPVTGQELFFAISYSKLALMVLLSILFNYLPCLHINCINLHAINWKFYQLMARHYQVCEIINFHAHARQVQIFQFIWKIWFYGLIRINVNFSTR